MGPTENNPILFDVMSPIAATTRQRAGHDSDMEWKNSSRNYDTEITRARPASSKWETVFVLIIVGFVVLDSLLFWLAKKH